MIERVRQGLPDGLDDLHTVVAGIAERYFPRQFDPQSCEDRVYDLYLLVLEAARDGALHDPGRLKRFVQTMARVVLRADACSRPSANALSANNVTSSGQLANRLMHVQDDERRRIARDAARDDLPGSGGAEGTAPAIVPKRRPLQ